ncbi:unnamed protein product [Rangifer tarandus platyrhynchus]|uniref:Uncharacterized protein n=1 Tax=Rangifer tarandus platyrhynchus TaxID=3082113 RepID=A0ABN9A495_RANTA|nr:unnamed protein product [Rangifer tarandus platyrhynchus]
MNSIPTELQFHTWIFTSFESSLGDSGVQLDLRAIVLTSVDIDYALLQKERTLKFQWLKIKHVHFSLHMLHRQGYRATLLIRIMLMEQLPQPLLMITIQKERKSALEALTPGIKFSSGPKVTQISSSHNASV